MPAPSRPDEPEAPWAETPRPEWDNLLPAVAPESGDGDGSRGPDRGGLRRPETTSRAATTRAGSAGASSTDAPRAHGSAAARGADAKRSDAGTTSAGGATSPGRGAHADRASGADRDERADAGRRAGGGSRASARDEALEDRPRALGLRRAVIAIAVPLTTLMLAMRLIATPAFLWLEYHRPGFPEDAYGFTTEDRMTYGSYGLNYILNFAPSRFLGDVVTQRGQNVFLPAEVSHMTDVKHVMLWALLGVTALAVIALLCMTGLRRKAPGAIRKSLFLGAWITLILLVVLGILAALGWESFFTTFHEIFFSGGNWTFRESDSLIRLYPERFWVDSAVVIALVSVLVSAVILAATWPTKARRQRTLQRVHERQGLRERLSR